MEITGTNPTREVKVEKAKRIKRSGQDQEGKKDNQPSFSEMLEEDMDAVELHVDESPAKSDNLQVSTDIVSLSGAGLVGSETKVASSDVVDLDATRQLAEKIKQAKPEHKPVSTSESTDDETDATVDTLA